MEVVKRLETRVEAVAFTLCKGRSVGGNTEKCDRFSSGLRCITSRCTGTEGNAIIMLRVHHRPVNSRPLNLSKLLVVTTNCKYIDVVTVELINYSIPLR
jgi:hypothetical protein